MEKTPARIRGILIHIPTWALLLACLFYVRDIPKQILAMEPQLSGQTFTRNGVTTERDFDESLSSWFSRHMEAETKFAEGE